ncbi:MAG TPA: Glu/Leu/Phe/Val dehydrogenase dimerization domain-containing protein [Dermatophilaceae bacterium]|nr:Glu/Leu/Phe/Val dehydrogenase dimerization domain-containing protein [Dermatophilaceae bacterium]
MAFTSPADNHPDAPPPGFDDRVFEPEEVAFRHDEHTGLRAIVAISSTVLGPALGGTRCLPYPGVGPALADVLRLARSMTLKNAAAGLDHGGGKAVILGDPRVVKTAELLRAYGRFVDSLGGRYVTACDIGTTVADMDTIGETTRFATGRSRDRGGAGDSGELTAYGVFQAMRAAAAHVWGSPELAGRTVGVEGVGKVGARLAGHLVRAGALVVVTDVTESAVARLRGDYPQVLVAPDAAALREAALDVYAPCALGGCLDDAAVDRLRARVVCGGANNQLADERLHGGTADRLKARGIVYAPDFLVNAGGVIQVSDELHGFDLDRATARTAGIFDTTAAVLARAEADRVSPLVTAVRLAEERIAAASRTGRREQPHTV